MEFEKAFYGENAANDFIKMLKMEYCYYKVVIVKSEDIKTNSVFENICNVCAKHCVINLPNNIEFNLLCEELVKKELTDDVSLVVVFANHNWAVAINKFFNNVAMVCLAPSINQLMVKTSMMVYDYSLVAKCSKNEFISCYGEICSILSYIMEVVFFKSVYNLNINSQQLLKLENIIRKDDTMKKILYDNQMFTLQRFGGVTRYFADLMYNLPQGEFTAEMPMRYCENHYVTETYGHKYDKISFPNNYRIRRQIYMLTNKHISWKAIKFNDFDIFHPTYFNPYFLKPLKKREKPFVGSVLSL